MNQSKQGGKGLLVAMMEPSPTLEQEFQDWYDSEHYPERAGTAGFLTANRLICLDGFPRYLALYDLTDVGVLHGPEYAKIAGERYSRWTHRIVPKVWGHYRAEGEQIYPGQAEFGDGGRASRIALWRFSEAPVEAVDAIVSGLRAIFENRPETAQLRVFQGRRDDGAGFDVIGVVELHAPFVPPPGAVESLGEARRHLDMVNCYTGYFRK